MARPLNLTTYSTVIAAGTALSPAVSIGADGIAGFVFPAGWTAASASFQVSVDGETFLEFYDGNGNPIGIAAGSTAGAAYVGVDPTLWRGVNMFRIRSGTALAPVNQASAAAVLIVGRGDEW